jgi:N-acetylmuramate 1-kinase
MFEFRERLEKFLLEKNQSGEFLQLTPDASTREYFRVLWRGKSAIACVYPLDESGEAQFNACLDVTEVFRAENLPVAEIYDFDAAKKIIIHEDFGDTILRGVLVESSNKEILINRAISLIAEIQAATLKAFELNSIASRLKFDSEKLLWELNFFKTHYFETLRNAPLSADENSALEAEFTELAAELEKRAKVLCHRDFHAANLMISGGELKIIDHQDARLGSIAYDLVSLLLDRVTEIPSDERLKEKKSFFLKEREKIGLEAVDYEKFDYEFQLMTVQRCLKAIGTFSFQSAKRGKSHFNQYIEPMFRIVLQACKNTEKFPVLRRLIKSQI